MITSVDREGEQSNVKYLQDNDQEVIFTILDKIPLEELHSFIHGFLNDMIQEKKLYSDAIISEYIQVGFIAFENFHGSIFY